MGKHVTWGGVFPAVTTQFRDDFSVDLQATHKVMSALLDDGVSGLIICGTVGENCSLTRSERIALMESAQDAARGRIYLPAADLTRFGVAEADIFQRRNSEAFRRLAADFDVGQIE